mmetsp:Transcript_1036/g.1465  ORF Transcript_1036/g.1465 Transcript_1036/m.1465 type:complete len:138 (-) Transcript_1036:172-585(-)
MGTCAASNEVFGPKVLVRIGYRSTMIDGSTIDSIIEKSEAANQKIEVGGALWYDPDTKKVHQILEGEERKVRKLLAKIMKDKRHKAIIVENMEKVQKRRFQEWGGMKLAAMPLIDNDDIKLKRPQTNTDEKQPVVSA